MKKIVDYVLCIIAIIIGGIVFLQFDVEGLLWNKNEVPAVSMNEIDANSIADYIGKPAERVFRKSLISKIGKGY